MRQQPRDLTAGNAGKSVRLMRSTDITRSTYLLNNHIVRQDCITFPHIYDEVMILGANSHDESIAVKGVIC